VVDCGPRLIAHELVDQAVARDDPVGAQEQDRKERALLRAPKRQKLAVRPHFERAQDVELHSC
jgi:hypothetical protein